MKTLFCLQENKVFGGKQHLHHRGFLQKSQGQKNRAAEVYEEDEKEVKHLLSFFFLLLSFFLYFSFPWRPIFKEPNSQDCLAIWQADGWEGRVCVQRGNFEESFWMILRWKSQKVTGVVELVGRGGMDEEGRTSPITPTTPGRGPSKPRWPQYMVRQKRQKRKTMGKTKTTKRQSHQQPLEEVLQSQGDLKYIVVS